MKKPAAPKSPFAKFIDSQYEKEAMTDYHEVSTRTVTLTFSAERACMFGAIAKRFGSTVSAFGGEVFEPAVNQMFLALTPEDRIAVATETDLELTRYLASKGITSTNDEGGSESLTWRRYADVCNRIDAEAEATRNE
jgi:hypothetical protein